MNNTPEKLTNADGCGSLSVTTGSASVLRDFNAWRRNECDYIEPPHSAKRIGEAIDDAVKALEPWQPRETAPKERARVLATYVGVYDPCAGSMSDGRFYPDGQCGSEPFTHWMLLPSLPNNHFARRTCLPPAIDRADASGHGGSLSARSSISRI